MVISEMKGKELKVRVGRAPKPEIRVLLISG
jgi:hypothetical protein